MLELNATFDDAAFLAGAGIGKTVIKFRKNAAIFVQGDDCEAVFYIQQGSVRASVVSVHGREATIALLNPGDFIGEECLAAEATPRSFSATAMTDSILLRIEKVEMVRVLKDESAMSARLVAHLLTRSSRFQADLVDHLFNSSEKRLARILLLLAHIGENGVPETLVPKISQQMLAEMVGCTRSRVSFFLNRFRQLGYIEYGKQISVNNSLLQVVLRD